MGSSLLTSARDRLESSNDVYVTSVPLRQPAFQPDSRVDIYEKVCGSLVINQSSSSAM